MSDTFGTPLPNVKHFKYRYNYHGIVCTYEWDAYQALGWDVSQDGFPYYYVVNPDSQLVYQGSSMEGAETALQNAGVTPSDSDWNAVPEGAANPSDDMVATIDWSASAGDGASVESQPSVSEGAMTASFNYPSQTGWASIEGTLGQALGDYRYVKITYKANHHFFFKLDTDGPTNYDEFGARLVPVDEWATQYVDFEKMGPPYWNYGKDTIDASYDTTGLTAIYFSLQELGGNSSPSTLEIREIVFYE